MATKVQVGCRIPADLHDVLKELAEADKRSVSNLAEIIITEALKRVLAEGADSIYFKFERGVTNE